MRSDPARLLAAAMLLAVGATTGAAAKDKAGAFCETNGTVSGEGQLKDRVKKCNKDDVILVSLLPASIAATRVAALICELADQILIEDTTEAPGVARVTCTFTGQVRDKR